jgi:hypothetical protein
LALSHCPLQPITTPLLIFLLLSGLCLFPARLLAPAARSSASLCQSWCARCATNRAPMAGSPTRAPLPIRAMTCREAHTNNNIERQAASTHTKFTCHLTCCNRLPTEQTPLNSGRDYSSTLHCRMSALQTRGIRVGAGAKLLNHPAHHAPQETPLGPAPSQGNCPAAPPRLAGAPRALQRAPQQQQQRPPLRGCLLLPPRAASHVLQCARLHRAYNKQRQCRQA